MDSRPPSPSPSALPPIPLSPTYSYASTANPIPSTFNLPLPPVPQPAHAVLTKNDLELSRTAYANLLSSAKAYRLALASISVSASTFGSALEACARLKEARSESVHNPGGSGGLSNSFTAKGNCTADSLLAASGVHQLIANHQQILSEVVYRSFEVPLLHEMDTWTRKIEEEEVTYQTSVKAMSKEITRLEKEGMKVYKQRKRDVGIFRQHLVNLTVKLDGLTSLHGGHARGLLRDCQETSTRIVECSAGLVRAEVDIFEALARKGWNGGGLDELLEKGKDLFSNDETPDRQNSNAEMFTILPPKSILVNADGRPGHLRADSMGTVVDQFQSLAGAVSGGRDLDVASIFSEQGTSSTSGILNRSRGARPFSPPPRDRVSDPGPLSEEGGSAVTVVPIGIAQLAEAEAERQKSNNKFEGSVDGSVDGSVEGGHDRGRERRWSVTDDGTGSD